MAADAARRLKPTLAERVAEQLRRLIDRGEFPRDCRLPTEFALCRRFGVSRPVVRAALAILRDGGYVRSLKGSGTVVLKGPEPGGLSFPLVRTIGDIEQYYEFRAALEAETAALAAERHTPASLGTIAAALSEAEEMARFGATELSGDINFRFHRAIARATDNAFHVAAIDALPNLIGLGPLEVRHAGHTDPGARNQVILDEHRAIFEAIRRREADLAGAEMRAHILAARRFVFQRHPAWPDATPSMTTGREQPGAIREDLP